MSIRRVSGTFATNKEPDPADIPKELVGTLHRLEKGSHLSRKACKILIELRSTSQHGVLTTQRVLVKIFICMFKSGRVGALIQALISLPSGRISRFWNSLSEGEKRYWTQPGVLRSKSLLYKLAVAVSEARNRLNHDQVCALFLPFGDFEPFAQLFFTSVSLPHGVSSRSTSSELRERADAFLGCIQSFYEDRRFNVRQAGTHLGWVLEATAIFLDGSSYDHLTCVVASIAHHIDLYANPDSTFASTSHKHPLGTHSSLPAHRRPLSDALLTMKVPYPLAHPTAMNHPASPYLLVATYLAEHSKLISEMLLDCGLLTLLERLFDHPPLTRYLGMPVSSISRQAMYQLSYELLVDMSKHIDIRDCTIKQELRDEIVAASRAASARWFDIQWWEVPFDDIVISRLKELWKADGFRSDSIQFHNGAWHAKPQP